MPSDPISSTTQARAVRPVARPVTVRPAFVHWFDTRRAERGPFPPLPAAWVTPPAPVRLARSVIALAVTWGVLQLLLLATVPGGVAPFAAGTAADAGTAYAWLSLVLLGVQVVTLLVVGTWIRRSQVFATYLAPDNRPRRGDAWPWFGWVLPVVSYWFGFQMVRDLRRATLGGRRAAHGEVVVGGWWAAWLALSLAANPIVLRAVGVQPGGAVSLVGVEIAVTALTGLALIPWVTIVREITRAQQERAVVRTGGRREVPAPPT